MADRPKVYVNGKLLGGVKSVDIKLDSASSFEAAAISMRKLNDVLWRAILDNEFGPT